MKNISIRFLFSMVTLLVLSVAANATPSTQIWNPSTDIQSHGSWHLGIDNYFTAVGPANGGYALPTDLGLTYGLVPGLEIGFDIFLPQSSPFVFNAKYGIGEGETLPALAIGGFGFGTEKGVTDQNIIYGVMAKTFPIGRISLGYFTGNEKLLVDSLGNKDNSGLLSTWDKALTEKIWACVDYAGTNSLYGSTFVGFSYAFSSNTSVIFGYGTYNNGIMPTITTQLDINF
ncbi:MAG: hypothetical protein V1843_00300 [bacterium]